MRSVPPRPPCETGDTRTACVPWLFGVSTWASDVLDITSKRFRRWRGVLFAMVSVPVYRRPEGHFGLFASKPVRMSRQAE